MIHRRCQPGRPETGRFTLTGVRIALVAGPEAGHAFPVFGLAERLEAADIETVIYTGSRWSTGRAADRFDIRELPGLLVADDEDDADAGSKLNARAARMARELAPLLASDRPDAVVSDVITVCGAMAGEMLKLPVIELCPHPLYLPSRALPPVGMGLAPGAGPVGRTRDRVLRAMTARALKAGVQQRESARAGLGLPTRDPGPDARLVATLPALELPRPDWPANTHLVGPLHWEPVDEVLTLPPGDAPLVVVAPSTADTGTGGMVDTALAVLRPEVLGMPVRVALSMLDSSQHALPRGVVAGPARQDRLLAAADLVVCGGGHGLLSKALLAGVPVVTVPGGGDQWELANRVQRQGSGLLVRPMTAAALAEACRKVLSTKTFAEAAGVAAETAAAVVDPVTVCRSAAATPRRL